MRRRILQVTSGGSINPSESKACDICFYDKINDSLIIANGDTWSVGTYPVDRYTPIGIVVVPGYHDVYGDGSCGVMSLKAMSCDTPSTGGTSNQGMYWGVYDVDLLRLPNLDKVPVGNTSDGIPTDQSDGFGLLPSEGFSGPQCAHDTNKSYSSILWPYIPSPYLTDGSRNPGYYQTSSPSSSNNALADFNGIENTIHILDVRGLKIYDSWKPTYNSKRDYPAASCCDMFYTDGTQQGDWYLPACGELGYIIPYCRKIIQTIRNIQDVYGASIGAALNNDNYLSSTEQDRNSPCTINTNSGSVGSASKEYPIYVRAFLRVK